MFLPNEQTEQDRTLITLIIGMLENISVGKLRNSRSTSCATADKDCTW